MHMITPHEIHEFWFGRHFTKNPLQYAEKWWKKDAVFDQQIKERFSTLLHDIILGHYERWKETSGGILAYVIVLDQFSRNMFRNTAQSFSQDSQALAASQRAQQDSLDIQLSPIERWFLYMPYMHSESLAEQERGLQLFKTLAEQTSGDLKETLVGAYHFAHQHYAIIQRFGRFPHRNQILNRSSTLEEIEFLKQPGSSF